MLKVLKIIFDKDVINSINYIVNGILNYNKDKKFKIFYFF